MALDHSRYCGIDGTENCLAGCFNLDFEKCCECLKKNKGIIEVHYVKSEV